MLVNQISPLPQKENCGTHICLLWKINPYVAYGLERDPVRKLLHTESINVSSEVEPYIRNVSHTETTNISFFQ
jgi:hypothetical protein